MTDLLQNIGLIALAVANAILTYRIRKLRRDAFPLYEWDGTRARRVE